MTRRSLMSLVAVAPVLAANTDIRKTNLSPGMVENLSASFRGSNTSASKTLLEISWTRPRQEYHGALLQGYIQQPSGEFTATEALAFSDPTVEAGSPGLALIDAEPLLMEAAGRRMRIVALPLDSTGKFAAVELGLAPHFDLRKFKNV